MTINEERTGVRRLGIRCQGGVGFSIGVGVGVGVGGLGIPSACLEGVAARTILMAEASFPPTIPTPARRPAGSRELFVGRTILNLKPRSPPRTPYRGGSQLRTSRQPSLSPDAKSIHEKSSGGLRTTGGRRRRWRTSGGVHQLGPCPWNAARGELEKRSDEIEENSDTVRNGGKQPNIKNSITIQMGFEKNDVCPLPHIL